MPRFRCYNPACGHKMDTGSEHEFEADGPRCPKCGAGHLAVARLVDVHLVIPSEKGAIAGAFGARQSVACMPDRPFLAGPGEDFSATGDPQAVTCPACKRHPQYRDMAKALSQLRAGFVISEEGCC